MVRKESKVWLEEDQIKELERSCERLKDKWIIELVVGPDWGLVRYLGVKARDLKEYNVEGYLQHFLEAKGKRTDQEKGQDLKKEREAFLPESVYSDLKLLINQEGLEGPDPLIPNKFRDHYSQTGIRQRVYTVSKKAHERTGT